MGLIVVLKFVSRLVNFVPGPVTRFAGDSIGWVWFFIFRFRRTVVIENLGLAFGSSKSKAEIQKIALRNFQHYGRTLMEITRSISWNKEDYHRNLVIEGWENLEPVLRAGKGGIFLTQHLGNWEFALAGTATRGVPVDIVVKRSRQPQAEQFLQWYRRKTGAGIFLEEGTAKDILRSLSRGRFVAFILDQFMGPPIGLPVKFFGQLAGTAAALALMTDKRDVPVIPAYSFRDEGGRVHVVYDPPIVLPPLPEALADRLYLKTQLYNDILEAHIRQFPEQWLWLHRRWKAFRGESRWNPVFAPVGLAVLLLCLTGCATGGGTAATGIDIPPDPKVSVPEFLPASEGVEAVEKVPVPPKVTEVPLVPKKKGENKKKQGAKVAEAPVPQPVAPKVGVPVLPKHMIPFELGERLEVDLTWMALPAGRAVLEVRQGDPFNGRSTFHLWGNVLSSKIVDPFYHIDNTAEAFVDAEALIPYKFLLHMYETHQKKETRVSFDHAQNKAYYWAKRLSEKWGNEDQDRVDPISPLARDMFSAVFYARALDYSLNKKQVFTVYENKQIADVELLPVSNELVSAKVGSFQCWKILVTVKINNVLSPMGETNLWLSDDSKKYVVKFDTKLKVGSMRGELVAIRERK